MLVCVVRHIPVPSSDKEGGLTRGAAEYATKSGGLGELSENTENILSGEASIS